MKGWGLSRRSLIFDDTNSKYKKKNLQSNSA